RSDGEIENSQRLFVQLVDHEAHNLVVVLGHHANAVSLPQAGKEILFAPGELEAGLLDFEHLGHIPPNEPADLHLHVFTLSLSETHGGLLAVSGICSNRSRRAPRSGSRARMMG